jgi:succinyl-CoA synthetase alpha subunit
MGNLEIQKLRELDPKVVCIGSHRGIIQSMLDFDYLLGRKKPSVIAVREKANLVLCLTSGRRVLSSMQEAMAALPKLVGGVVFAEGFPERHATQLRREAEAKGVWIIGGASVGIVVPGVFKLGAIGGVDARQLDQARLFTPGKVAVVSSSGGMVNEVIQTVARSGNSLSFSTALGGERFPMSAPVDVFSAAQNDPETEAVVYFGELGGRDEYVLVEQLKSGALTKPVVCYIAGTVAELFEEAPQFGHAKAIARNTDESARAKAAALEAAGARVGRTFAEFVDLVRALPRAEGLDQVVGKAADLADRTPALMSSSISGDVGGNVRLLGEDLLTFAEAFGGPWAIRVRSCKHDRDGACRARPDECAGRRTFDRRAALWRGYQWRGGDLAARRDDWDYTSGASRAVGEPEDLYCWDRAPQVPLRFSRPAGGGSSEVRGGARAEALHEICARRGGGDDPQEGQPDLKCRRSDCRGYARSAGGDRGLYD